MIFQTEEVTECQTDRIPLDACGAVPGALDAAELRATAMVCFAAPPVSGGFYPLGGIHLQVARGLVVTATVWGDHREDIDKAIALQMHERVRSRKRYVPDRSIARPIGITQAIGFQAGQPLPVQCACQRQVLQAAYQPSTPSGTGLKSPCRCRLHHRPDVVIGGHPVVCFVVDTDVAGQVSIPIGLPQADQIDAHDDPLIVPRLLVCDQLAGPAIRRVQRRVADNQDARGQRNTGLHYFLHGVAIRTTPVPQSRGGIVRRTIRGGTRMAAYCCGSADHVLRCDENADIIQFVPRWCVHLMSPSSVRNTADVAPSTAT